jgi:hypothetical protein
MSRNRNGLAPPWFTSRWVVELSEFPSVGLFAQDSDCNRVRALLCFVHSSTFAVAGKVMVIVHSRTWLRLALGGVLTLLPYLAAPAPVRASCGDYVMLGHDSPHTTLPARQGVPSKDASTPAPKPAVPPCSGPGCSQHRQPLAPPPSAAPRWIEDRCAPTDAGVALQDSPGDLLHPALALPYQLLLVSSIYHPPR